MMFSRQIARILNSFCQTLVPSRPKRLRARQQWHAMRDLQTLEVRQLLSVTGLQAIHRSGQTFLTWQEDTSVAGEKYHVYRSATAITTQNLSSAELLTARWGPLDDNTSVHQLAGSHAPRNFVISDLGTPLSDNHGLFVYTTPAGQSGQFYYAVTEVMNGIEQAVVTNGSSSLSVPVTEIFATPQPVLVSSGHGGKSRVYTQFMDYAQWNPTFQGYAYNYSVALPHHYEPDTAYALKVMPHAYGERYRVVPEAEYEWPAIELFVDDPGGDTGSVHTWWYGFAADHDYKNNGPVPTSGRIENYTEQRVLKAIDEVTSIFRVNTSAIHVEGHSMGGSGALSLGMRYGNVFAGTFSSQPMTNYASSPLFQEEFRQLWGSQQTNLPVVNRGRHAEQLRKYDNTGVYQWMNHQQQIVARRGDEMAFLMFGHGKADDVIDWQTQGREFIAYVNQARIGFTAEQRGNWEHNFMSFDFVNVPLFSTADGGLGEWIFQSDVSFLAVTHATRSGPDVPALTGTDFYNRHIDWSVPWNSFHKPIVDTAGHYEVSVRSQDGDQIADITPRNLQQFLTAPGITVQWKNVRNSTGQVIQSGTVMADAAGLLTIPRFHIGTGTGNRLVMETVMSQPRVTTPPGTTTDTTPTFAWTGVVAAAGYQVWIENISTGQNPLINQMVQGTTLTPESPWGIGRYRIWVRALSASGKYSAWSAPVDLHIQIAPTFPDLPTWIETSTPTIVWTAVPGAATYDVWIRSNTTGQSPFLRQIVQTGNSWQASAPLPTGKYTIWVAAIDGGGRSSGWSLGRVFNIVTRPEALTPEGNSVEPAPEFSWNPVPGAATYGLYVVNRRTGAVQVDQHGITATRWSSNSAFAMGEYRWWVRAFSTSGQPAFWSHLREFSIGLAPTLLTPGGTTADRTPAISWTSVNAAVRYELWVARSTGGVIIHLTNITSTSYTPTSDLNPGSYRIWVRAIGSNNFSSAWSSPVEFTVVDSIFPGTRDESEALIPVGPAFVSAEFSLPNPGDTPTSDDATEESTT